MFAELIACAVTLAASPGTTLPGTAVIGQSEVPWPIGGGMMDFGVKTTSDSYTDGHFSITAPVFSSIGQDGTLGGCLVFIEPYISWGEQGEVATSLGLGFRHLFNQQPLSALQGQHTGLLDEGVMLGGNLFLDMLDTQSNNRFWQLGFGLEFETRYLALRGNYYHPLTDRQEGEPILQRDVQRATFLTSGEEPFATGHTIQQDLTFTTYDFYTDRLYRTYEEGMKGWDVEAAVIVPWLDKWCELWLIGGYGDFQNQPFGPQIAGTGELHGWKAGIEFRPIPQLVLSATHYEEKRMAGGEWLYGLSLQLPLDPEPQNPGKSWWRKIKDTLKPRSRHLAERAAVPVHRQNAAVKVANSISEPEVKQYAKVVSEEEKRVVVRDDVIFVNNGGAQGNGIAAHGAVEDGTAERPFDLIQEGVDLSATAGYQVEGVPTVFVAGHAIGGPIAVLGGYHEMIESRANIHLVTGPHAIAGYLGIPFQSSSATIVGDIRIQPAPGDENIRSASVIGFNLWSFGRDEPQTILWADHLDFSWNNVQAWKGAWLVGSRITISHNTISSWQAVRAGGDWVNFSYNKVFAVDDSFPPFGKGFVLETGARFVEFSGNIIDRQRDALPDIIHAEGVHTHFHSSSNNIIVDRSGLGLGTPITIVSPDSTGILAGSIWQNGLLIPVR